MYEFDNTSILGRKMNMEKKTICFIAQFPPPMHGLSKAVETLYNSKISEEFNFEKIDITDNKRIIRTLISIFKSKADLFYFTISQTIGGNLRDLVILKLLSLLGKNCLIHLHGGYYRQLVDNDMPYWQKKANYSAMKRLAGAIVLGPSLKYIFQGMIPDEKIYIVPNCVDDTFLMSDEEFEEKIKSISERGLKHVLYLSNFIKAKGYPEVLKMAKIEKKRIDAGGDPKLHFDFAGDFFDKQEKTSFFDYIKANQLEDLVTYHGVVYGEKKKELLRQSDVFMLLTRYPKEGQPISILEAMGNGLLVVTTNHAGIPDIVRDDCGIVLDKDSEKLYKEAFESIMRADLYEKSVRGREFIMKCCSQNKYLDNMSKIFHEITVG